MTPLELKKLTNATWREITEICGLKSPIGISRWHNIPSKYLLALEKALGIPREKMRPDLYRTPPPTKEESQ